MIHATSRLALAEFDAQLNQLLAGPAGSGVDRRAIAEELYSVAGLLVDQPQLRRSLGDGSTDASRRADLAKSLLAGKVAPLTADIAATAVGLRWSSPWDLTDAIGIAADATLLSAAEQASELDEVENDLFRFDWILQSSGELTSALDAVAVPAAHRIKLAETLLAAKVRPISLDLIKHAIASGRRTRLQVALDDLLEATAKRRDRSVAKVISARELTTEQSRRLAKALTRIYGRDISIQSAVDAGIQGGLVVRVGDEVIDGTVSARLASARAALAG